MDSLENDRGGNSAMLLNDRPTVSAVTGSSGIDVRPQEKQSTMVISVLHLQTGGLAQRIATASFKCRIKHVMYSRLMATSDLKIMLQC